MPRKAREREREQQRKDRKRTQEPAGAAQAAGQPPDGEPALLQLAAEIADRLGETEDEPRGTVRRVVERLGAERAQALLDDALAIEEQGGLWLADRSRRRTLGGVFFYIVRERSEKADQLAIFYPQYEQNLPLDRAELGALLADLAQWPRDTPQELRFRLVGRPTKIPAPQPPPGTPYVIYGLESSLAQVPPLPKELPPIEATTSFRVLVAAADWQKIGQPLLKRSDSRIGLLGLPAINPKRPELITVRAASMKLLSYQTPRPDAEAAADAAAPSAAAAPADLTDEG